MLVAEPVAVPATSMYSRVKPLLISWATAAWASDWLSKTPITVCDMIFFFFTDFVLDKLSSDQW
jgi:hypothetical protein